MALFDGRSRWSNPRLTGYGSLLQGKTDKDKVSKPELFGPRCGQTTIRFGPPCGIRNGPPCGKRVGTACRIRIGTPCRPRIGPPCGVGNDD